MSFSKILIDWYHENKRDLPWRNTVLPYRIWLSEIILQQTRVNQGLPYYQAFVENYPTVQDLAEAEEESVLKLWQGLGYYSRARNLHATAKTIVADFNGVFPNTYKDLMKLKGVGNYTAAAIASFAFNECVPVVDGNVYRVISRYYGNFTDIATSSAHKIFFEITLKLIDSTVPALFNQAIMEFGALQCTPKNPDCGSCPFQKSCYAFQEGCVDSLPIKTKKITVSNRFFNYLYVLDADDKSILIKRDLQDIWKNLYEFPLIETDSEANENLLKIKIKEKYAQVTDVQLFTHESIKHKLSHQQLNIKFWKVKIDSKHKLGLTYEEMMLLPMPIVLHNFLARNKY